MRALDLPLLRGQNTVQRETRCHTRYFQPFALPRGRGADQRQTRFMPRYRPRVVTRGAVGAGKGFRCSGSPGPVTRYVTGAVAQNPADRRHLHSARKPGSFGQWPAEFPNHARHRRQVHRQRTTAGTEVGFGAENLRQAVDHPYPPRSAVSSAAVAAAQTHCPPPARSGCQRTPPAAACAAATAGSTAPAATADRAASPKGSARSTASPSATPARATVLLPGTACR